MFRRSCHPQDAYTNAVNTYRNKIEFNNDQAYQMCGFQLKFTVQGGSNMTGTDLYCLHTNQSRSYLNHLVLQTSLQNHNIICNMV